MNKSFVKILCLFLIMIAFHITAYSQSYQNLLIKNVAVIPLADSLETVLYDQDVFIVQGKIKKIRPSNGRNAKGYKIIDGSNRFLIPGMADMHAHMPEESSNFSTQKFYALNLANGITTIRQMRGKYANLATRDSVRKGLIVGCHTFISTPYLWDGKSFSSKMCRDSLMQYQKYGFDFIKYLYGLSAQQYDTLAAIANELQYKITGHIPKHDLAHAVDLKISSVEHIEPFIKLFKTDSVLFWRTINKMASLRLYSCPDLQWYIAEGPHTPMQKKFSMYGINWLTDRQKGTLKKEAEAYYSESYAKDPVQFARTILEAENDVRLYKRLLKGIHSQGVPLLISAGEGNFITPGFSFIDELKLFVEAGISPHETLRAATINAAEFFNERHIWGSVEENKRADLVLLSANPLKDIGNISAIEAVIVDGHFLKSKDLLKPFEQ